MANLNNCVCALFATMTTPQKNQMKSMLQIVKALLMMAKSQAEMYNVNYADLLTLAVLKLESSVLHAALDPVIGPILAVRKFVEPWVDCDPNQTLMESLKFASDVLMGPTKALDEDIAILQNQIDQQDRHIQFLDNKINMFDDYINMLDNICSG